MFVIEGSRPGSLEARCSFFVRSPSFPKCLKPPHPDEPRSDPDPLINGDGYPADTALTPGRFVAGSSARAKARCRDQASRSGQWFGSLDDMPVVPLDDGTRSAIG